METDLTGHATIIAMRCNLVRFFNVPQSHLRGGFTSGEAGGYLRHYCSGEFGCRRRMCEIIAAPLMALVFCCVTGAPLMAGATAANTGGVPHWRVRLAAITKSGAIASVRSATVMSWTPQGNITIETQGKTLKFSIADVLSMRRINHGTPTTAATRAVWWLRMRTGDELPGNPLESKNGKLTFKSVVFGTLIVPLDDVEALSRTQDAATKSASAQDHLTFINGDTLSGTMLKFTPQGVQWNSSLGTITIPLARIKTIMLAQTLPPVIPGGPLIRVTCTDGTVMTATHITWNALAISFNPVALAAVTCGVDDVRKIDILGGRITWLTAIKPEHYVQTPYTGAPWPLMINKNSLGQALHTDGRVFHHGLGIHVAAKLTYALDSRYSTLAFIPAMDQSARPWGTATVSVTADGKRIFKSGVLQAGTALQPVMVEVSGVKTLKISVDGTNRFGVRGRVNLLDAALLK